MILVDSAEPEDIIRLLKQTVPVTVMPLNQSNRSDYYFGGDPSRMPPQGHINSGQKLWCLTILVSGVVFVVTGIIMWGFKGTVSPGVFQWTVFAHDVAFIAAGSFFLIHFHLSVLHPRMSESLRSMIKGKISREYAESHYGKWYDEISKST